MLQLKKFILSEWFTLLVLAFVFFVAFGLPKIHNLIIEIAALILGIWIVGAHIYRQVIKWGKKGAAE